MNPVQVSDIEARWRVLSQREKVVAGALLSDAWAEVRARVADVDHRLIYNTLDEAAVVRVVCAMVLRVIKKPDAVQAEAPDAYAYQRDGAQVMGELYMTPDELAMLAPAAVAVGMPRSIRLGLPGYS